MAITLESLKARRKAAGEEKRRFQPLLDDVYEYMMPYRRGVSETGKGDKRVNRVFDHTAIVSAFRTANTLAQDISPAGQQVFSLTVGPLARRLQDADQLKEAQQQLEIITTVISAHFQTGEWDAALAEMSLDLMASTGVMLIVPDARRGTARFVTVPLDEVLLTSDGYNDVDGIFWERKWALRALDAQFGSANWPQAVKQRLEKEPEATVALYQDTVFDSQQNKWLRVAWVDNMDGGQPVELERTTTRTCPFLTPRHFKVPGETFGRGPCMLVSPTVKALNTGKKLTLQAAAIAMLGIYTVVDDGVFNQDNSPVAPAQFWKVARNGGTFGPTVQRFPDPRIDLSQLVFKDMGMEVQMGMGDQQLPPDTAAVRSATEIMERVKRLANDHMGAFGRLVMEIMVPAVRRVMEIAYEMKQLPATVAIDRLLVDIQVSSPMALAREAERMQKVTRYVEAAVMMLQAKAAGVERYAKLDKIVVDMARSMTVPEDYIPSEDDRKQMDEMAAQQAAAAIAAQVAEKNPDMAAQALGEVAAA